MPAPAVTARSDSQQADPTTTHTVEYPVTLNVGEKVVCSFVPIGGAGQVVTFPADWTVLGTGGLGGGGGIYHTVAEHDIDGTEGATFQVTTGTSVESCHRCWSGPFGDIVTQSGPDTNNNSLAEYPTVNVTAGDYLILALLGLGGSAMTASTPTDYGETFSQDTGAGDACGQFTFERSLTGITTETPGDSTLSSAERWATFTVAIPASDTGQTIPVGQVTEISLAQAMGRSKLAGIGVIAETDSAFLMQSSKTAGLGLITEIDLSQTIATVKARGLGLVSETDTAQALSGAVSRTVNQVIETDIAQAVGPAKARAVQQAIESDVAQAIAVATGLVVGLVTETDLAQSVDASKVHGVGLVSEFDSVFTIGVQRVLILLQVAETDTVFALAVAKLQALGLVTETDFAFAMTVVGGTAIGPVNNPGITSGSPDRGIRSASVARGITSGSPDRGITRH